MTTALQTAIEAAWEARDGVNTSTKGQVREAVEETLNRLDAGTQRVATRGDRAGVVVFGRDAATEVPPLDVPWQLSKIESLNLKVS